MKWNLAEENRIAAQKQLWKKGRNLKEFPWPEDHYTRVEYDESGEIVIEVK